MNIPKIKVIILAAGKGRRLLSEANELPKALRRVCGKPLIRYVLNQIDFVDPSDITIIVGYRKEQVMEELGGGYRYVEQVVLDGTAHAVEYARASLEGYEGPVMVLYCDMPLLSRGTYRGIVERHILTGADQTLLSGVIDPIPPYGRLIRDAGGRLVDIVEEGACTPEQKLIAEVNVGIQVFNAPQMWEFLARVPYDYGKDPPERYLTAAAGVYARAGKRIEVYRLADPDEAMGVNTEDDLERVASLLGGGL
ncbi:MAG: NTP transferase domain-containing protein [Oscillospiraceae bacterium]|jgi:bifunctional N-acetylglucosamine-1-phosphate-uridyltransferase/glucosamine-1-phosphate-acetyltransferase GlmU-like protein|nr:NTP transferase domain-containing protein [Oscillospiraceae bacterium]